MNTKKCKLSVRYKGEIQSEYGWLSKEMPDWYKENVSWIDKGVTIVFDESQAKDFADALGGKMIDNMFYRGHPIWVV